MITLLAPLFQGEWTPLGERLQCSPARPADAVLLNELLRSPTLLPELLQRHAHHLGVTGPDQRAAASAWSLGYLWALLPPVIAAASLLQHRFEVGAAQLAVQFDDHGEVVAFHVPDEGRPMPGSTTRERYRLLLEDHVEPLFEVLHARTGLAPKILWSNLARYTEAVLDHAMQRADAVAALQEDRAALLERPAWPDGKPNPLHGRARRVVVLNGQPVALYRHCCLYYRLPAAGYCSACPLDPLHRRNTPRDSAPSHGDGTAMTA